jgi:Raf kinase inhibitor-like YbhB/YbcL family protein
MPLQVSSLAFSNGAQIPTKYTCDGENLAPPLEWRGVPEPSKSLALICDDPDAPSGTFTHWVLYDIPPSTDSLPEQPTVGTAGVNSYGKRGFAGPCPPKNDDAHHYHFHVYALDVASLGPPGLSKEDALQAMNGHILAEAELVGLYNRATT